MLAWQAAGSGQLLVSAIRTMAQAAPVGIGVSTDADAVTGATGAAGAAGAGETGAGAGTAGVGAGGAGIAGTAAATGTAGAQPDIDAVVNSTCTYPQVTAALNDQAPDAAADPQVTGWLQQLIASPPDQRRGMVAQVEGQLQPYAGLITQIAHTCNNY